MSKVGLQQLIKGPGFRDRTLDDREKGDEGDDVCVECGSLYGYTAAAAGVT